MKETDPKLKSLKAKFLCQEDGWKEWRRFPHKAIVKDKNIQEKKEWALTHSINSAVFRGCVYDDETNDRSEFREAWKKQLRKAAEYYDRRTTDALHIRRIVQIADKMSANYGILLCKERMRIGISQKALNLYLKYLWCLDEISVPPPHCPFDNVVLNKIAKIPGGAKWTQMDCILKYDKWVAHCRGKAKEDEFAKGDLALWELKSFGEKR